MSLLCTLALPQGGMSYSIVSDCCAALSHGAMGLHAVPGLTHLLFCYNFNNILQQTLYNQTSHAFKLWYYHILDPKWLLKE